MIEICKNCKSDNVARLQWVNPNTNKVNNNLDPGVYTEWCFDCNKETTIIFHETVTFRKELLKLIIKNYRKPQHEIANQLADFIKKYLLDKSLSIINSDDDHSSIMEYMKIKNFLNDNL
jgi:hypothetical protein